MIKKRFNPIKDKSSEIIDFLMASPDMPGDDALRFKIELSVEEAVENVVRYAYEGGICPGVYYDFDSRSEEFINDLVKPEFAKINRVGVWISHDTFVVPITVYGTNKKVNLRYFDTKQWIYYLAGLAIIMDASGNIRYVPVKGLDTGTLTM